MESTKINYGMNFQKGTQLVMAGFVATVVMVAFSYLLRAMGIAAPDFAAEYGAIVNSQVYPEPYGGTWWFGLVWHVINGTFIFSILFDVLAHFLVLTNERWLKSLAYGFGIWLMVACLVAPLAGEGFFFANTVKPGAMAVCSLLSWLLYGLTLEKMTRVRMVHQLGIADKHAA